MAHKTITISEKAYNSLKSLKKKNESFTDVILRITSSRKQKEDLIAWLNARSPSDDLIDSIDSVYKNRSEIELRY